jgi:hypothetical protein
MSRAWGAAAVAALSWSVWEGGRSQSSGAAHWSVLATIALVLAAAVGFGRHRQAATASQWVGGPFHLRRSVAEEPATALGATVWTALVLATIGWDLYSFARERHDLPTLSRLFGDLTGHWAGRSAVFALWLALGIALAIGWRRPR